MPDAPSGRFRLRRAPSRRAPRTEWHGAGERSPAAIRTFPETFGGGALLGAVAGLSPASSGTFGRGEITGSSLFVGLGSRTRSSAYGYLIDIRDHEVTHVDLLVGVLGANAVGACTFDFSSARRSCSRTPA